MKQELMDAIQETPVIAAVKDDDGLQNALQNENIRVVFILYGDICSIASIVQRIHAAGKFAIVHVDLIAGLASKEVAVDFIRSQTEADGIISTRQSFIRRAKELGLAAILRVFLLDSISLESLGKMPANLPDCLDILPGTMPKILRRVCADAKVPVLTGGLIADKEDVMAALDAGATAISTTNQAVWKCETHVLQYAQKEKRLFVASYKSSTNPLKRLAIWAAGGYDRANISCLFQRVMSETSRGYAFVLVRSFFVQTAPRPGSRRAKAELTGGKE